MPICKFLSPKNDIAFKKIFGTEKNKDILIHFLNDMLIFKENHLITDVTFLKMDQEPNIAFPKNKGVNILCKDKQNNTYVVKMQVANTKDVGQKAQYNAAKAYISQMDRKGGIIL